MTFVFVT